MTDRAIAGTGSYLELSYAEFPTFAKAPQATGQSLRHDVFGLVGVPLDAALGSPSSRRLGLRRMRDDSNIKLEPTELASWLDGDAATATYGDAGVAATSEPSNNQAVARAGRRDDR
jgi:hypothetical protein